MKALRVTLIVVGAVLVLGGWAGRSIQEEYGGTDYESVVRDDGTMAIYEPDAANVTFEIEEVDDSTAEVYAIPNDGGERDLVFSGTPARATDFYESRGKVLVFEGSQTEADAWLEANEERASVLVPNMVIAVGVALIIARLATGVLRSRDQMSKARPPKQPENLRPA
jgi:hypothetical protein